MSITKAFMPNLAELENTTIHRALFEKDDRQGEILKGYSPEQQREITYKQKILSSLASFIGKDFRIPVELNEPGEGWHWDFQVNRIRIDPDDLLKEPMPKLRFKTAHEGGHRRISRATDIPVEVWQQPGFSFMNNAIEDPRDNNFVAESYPSFKEDLVFTYSDDLDIEGQAKQTAKDQLGFQPRFITAGFEYIKQWFRTVQDLPIELSEDLSPEVKAVVEKTVMSVQDAWLRYPSKQEADQSEDVIRQYAKVSYEIQRDEVWPEFKKLVDADMQDQKVQEMMKQIMGQQDQADGGEGQPSSLGQGGGSGVPQDLKDKLSEAEKQELEKAMQEAQQKTQPDQQGQSSSQPSKEQPGSGQKRAPIDLDSISPELKQKLKDHADSLPQPTQADLEKMAVEAMKELEELINEMHAKASDNPDKKSKREEKQEGEPAKLPDGKQNSGDDKSVLNDYEQSDEFRKFQQQLERVMHQDEGEYERNRRDVLPVIDELETDLRDLFVQRRANRWQSGFRSGKRINITKRMQEKALGVSPVESRAWQKRELPQEKDYAVSLLVDLSGSMRGDKIDQTFKGAIVLAEVLNRLSINTEILGFNDKLYEYQPFGQDMSEEVRAKMGTMPGEVESPGAAWNDDGWALDQASERLARQKASEKFIFVLSDGVPIESHLHPRSSYDLESIIKKIMRNSDQKLIGLGIGPGTGHVSRFYPNSVANIGVTDMPGTLADVIREAIANSDAF